MIVYEVTLRVQTDIAAQYREWLSAHVQEMLSIEGFVDAVVEQQLDPPQAGFAIWCTRYQLRSQTDLDNYLRDHAARMRADGVQRFGDKFSATRRVLRIETAF